MKRFLVLSILLANSCSLFPKGESTEYLVEKGRQEQENAKKEIAEKKNPTESLDKAISYFSEAITRDKNFSADVYIFRAQCYELKGNLDDAINDYTEAFKMSRGRAALMGKGRCYSRKAAIKSKLNQQTPEEFDLAVINFTDALNMDKTDKEGWYGRAKTLVDKVEFLMDKNFDARNEIDLALKDLDSAIGLDKSHAPSFLARGQLYIALAKLKNAKNEDPTEELQRAVDEIRSSLNFDQTNFKAYFLAGVAEQELARLKIKALRDPIDSLNYSIDYLRKSLERQVTSEAYLTIGVSHMVKSEYAFQDQSKEINAAIESFNNAIILSPTFEAYFNKGMCHSFRAMAQHKKGLDPTTEFNAAIECYTNSLGYKDDYDVYYKRALATFDKASYAKSRGIDSTEDFKKAVADFEKSMAINPAFAKPMLKLGIAAYLGNDYDKSIDVLSRYLISDQGNTQAIAYRGHAYLARGKRGRSPEDDFSRASLDFENLIKRDQKDTKALLGKGFALFYKADFKIKNSQDATADLDESIKAFKSARDIDQNDHSAHINLAAAYYMKGKIKAVKKEDAKEDLTNAITTYNDALKIKKDDPLVYSALGSCYYLLDDKKIAIEHWAKAITLDLTLKPLLEPWILKAKIELEKPPEKRFEKNFPSGSIKGSEKSDIEQTEEQTFALKQGSLDIEINNWSKSTETNKLKIITPNASIVISAAGPNDAVRFSVQHDDQAKTTLVVVIAGSIKASNTHGEFEAKNYETIIVKSDSKPEKKEEKPPVKPEEKPIDPNGFVTPSTGSETKKIDDLTYELTKGSLTVKAANWSKSNATKLTIKTPSCQVTIKGPEVDDSLNFEIKIEDKITTITVKGGTLEISNSFGTAVAQAGETIVVKTDTKPEKKEEKPKSEEKPIDPNGFVTPSTGSETKKIDDLTYELIKGSLTVNATNWSKSNAAKLTLKSSACQLTITAAETDDTLNFEMKIDGKNTVITVKAGTLEISNTLGKETAKAGETIFAEPDKSPKKQ